MIRHHLPRLLFAAAALSPLRAEEKSVSIAITGDQNHAVSFTTPTGSDTADHKLIINGTGVTANNATMTSGITTSTAHDSVQWTKEKANGLSHPYKITAAKSTTPLAVIIDGTLKDKAPVAIPGSGGGSMQRSKDFKVKVPYAAAVTTETVNAAQDGVTPNTRLIIGVGEEVRIRITRTHLGYPAISSTGGWVHILPNQKTTNNSLPAGTDEFYFRAPGPDQSGTVQPCTVTLTFSAAGTVSVNGVSGASSRSATITFSVIVPTGESVTKTGYPFRPQGINPIIPGRPGVGMNLEYAVLPKHVCFSEVEVKELGFDTYGKPQNPTKFFERLFKAIPNLYIHEPYGSWTRYGDTTSGDEHSWLDDAGLVLGTFTDIAKPYESGSRFHWTIPVRWKCFGEKEFNLYTRTQTFEILDAQGTLRVSKNDSAGKTVTETRKP